MSYRSDFFTAVETSPGVYDREYNAAVFANRFSKLFGNGVVVEGCGLISDELQVMVAGSSMDVSISLGYALINGYAFEVYSAAETLTIDAADPTNPRIDRVVLELNLTNDIRAIRPLIVKGTPAGSPTAPTLTRTADLYQISLAQVLVPAGVSVLPGNAITDERTDNTVCGIANVTVGLGPNGYALDADLTAHTGNTTTAHGATSEATASKLMIRDASGRAKVAAPAADDDIARKDSITKAAVGLSNVTNDAQVKKAGDTLEGALVMQTNTNYTVAQARNVILSSSSPSGGNNGDIWIKYVT